MERSQARSRQERDGSMNVDIAREAPWVLLLLLVVMLLLLELGLVLGGAVVSLLSRGGAGMAFCDDGDDGICDFFCCCCCCCCFCCTLLAAPVYFSRISRSRRPSCGASTVTNRPLHPRFSACWTMRRVMVRFLLTCTQIKKKIGVIIMSSLANQNVRD